MSQERPLSRLAAYVAAARARGRPTRLVLRNSDRFGLVHLYFQQGHLVAVEGYRGSGRASLVAVASWADGTIRQDDLDTALADAEPDAALERDLDTLVNTLQARVGSTGPLAGALTPPPVGASAPSAATPMTPAAFPSAPSSATPVDTLRASLPSLPSLDAVPGPSATPPAAWASAAQHPQPGLGSAPGESVVGGTVAPGQDPSLLPLTPSRWQVMAQALHNIVERAGAGVGKEVAAGFLLQALNRLTAHSSFLAKCEVDDAAWVRVQPAVLARYPAYEVAAAVAELIMGYEERCAAMVGETGARRVITEAIAPLRLALMQVGLDFAES